MKNRFVVKDLTLVPKDNLLDRSVGHLCLKVEEGYCWVPRSLAGWLHHKAQRRQVVPGKRMDKLGPGNMLDIQKASGCADWLLVVALGLARDLV